MQRPAVPQDVSSIKLSLNRALWGEVTSSLKAVYFGANADLIEIFCIFDGVISADDEDSMSVVATSVAADFPAMSVHEHCLRIDAPERLNVRDGCHMVFFRKE